MQVIEEYNLSVRLTPNQNILLCDIQPQWKEAIESELRAAGVVPPSEIDSLDRNSMACPALPLCGLAITEAERGLPDINRRVRALLDKVGLPGETIVMRMTGCPNGCAPACAVVNESPLVLPVSCQCPVCWESCAEATQA